MSKAKFGVRLKPADNWDSVKNSALECERLGYHAIWKNDHMMYPLGGILECWSTLASLASVTKRIRLGSLVTCVTFRPPSVLAKIVSTVDVISGGRVDLGLGLGHWRFPEHRAFGLFHGPPKARLERLEETVEIVKKMWIEKKTSYEGKYYTIQDATCDPSPVQKPHPPIMIGCGKRCLSLKVIAEHANSCNFWCEFESYNILLDRLKEYCRKIGRNFKEIEKSWAGSVCISKNKSELKRLLKKEYLRDMGYGTGRSFSEWLNRFEVTGTPDECVKKIEKYLDIGVTYFILVFTYAQSMNGPRIFAKEVMSQFQ